MARDMVRSGYTPEAVNQMRARYEREVVVEDWPGSWDAVLVYQLADLEVHYAFDGPHFHPPGAPEIESVARSLDLAWTGELLWAVRVMANAACEVHNTRVRRG